MTNRRAILRGAIALATGSALTGTATATPSSGAEPGWIPYDAATIAGTETTIAARIDPEAVETAPIPAPLATPLTSFRDRFDSLSPDVLEPIRGTLALEGDRVVGGGLVIDGSFDRNAVEADLTAGPFRRVEATSSRTYYRARSAPYVIGLGQSSISVGYGPDGSSPDHASAVAAGRSSSERTSRLETIATAIDADSMAVATLGPETRSAAIDRVPEGVTDLAPFLEAARGIGVGVSVGESRSRVSYGLDVDPTAVSPETYWNLITSANDRATGFELRSVDRSGRTVLIRGTVPTAELWSAHQQMAGIESG